MAAMVVYQEHQNHGSDNHAREPSEDFSPQHPISASEVEEASNLVFRRSSTPSGDETPLRDCVELSESLHLQIFMRWLHLSRLNSGYKETMMQDLGPSSVHLRHMPVEGKC